jgi:large subunit ribosomal protein L1
MRRAVAAASLLLGTGAHAYVLPAQPHLSGAAQPLAGSRLAEPVMASRRYAELVKEVDKDKLYTPQEAIALMKKCANAKFVETAELHGNLNLDPKYNDQQIRTTVSLPHGTGKPVRVAVLAEGEGADAAKEAGADIVGMADLIEDISAGKLEFDILLATPPAMPKLAKLGKVLGPKGLMPSPKAGTVTTDPGASVKEFKGGKLEFRTDKQGVVHVPFGKLTFDENSLAENLAALSGTIEKERPSGCKGKLWKTAAISSTMGPGIKIDLAALKAMSA